MSVNKGRVGFIERFPQFFKADEEGFGLSDRGIWTEPGWDGVIGDLLEKLAVLDLPREFRVIQIKQDMGELRFYCQGPLVGHKGRAVIHAIAEAKERSVRTCEKCGLPATRFIEHGWWRTLCAECRQ